MNKEIVAYFKLWMKDLSTERLELIKTQLIEGCDLMIMTAHELDSRSEFAKKFENQEQKDEAV